MSISRKCRVGAVFTIVVLSVLGWNSMPAFAEIRDEFAQDWVRSRPFTITGWSNYPAGGVSTTMFGPSGLNTFFSSSEPLISSHSAAGYPWIAFLGNPTGLTQTVMDKANHLYSTYPGGIGWFVNDEPDVSEYAGVAEVLTWLRSEYPQMLSYSNLSWQSLGTIDNYINTVHPDVLMYDYYPCRVGSEAMVDYFFSSGMDYRTKGKQYNIPYFAYLQAYGLGSFRYPSESEIRWEAFAYLTMGYKGLSYYRYSGDSGLVVGPTTKGPMYDYVAAMNPEVLHLGNVLTQAESTAVRYVRGPGGRSTPSGLSNWSAGAGGDDHITNIQVLNSGYEKNGLIGFFEDDNGEDLFMLTNLNHGSTLSAESAAVTFQLTFDSSINDLLCWDRIANEQTVVALNNHMLEVTLPGGTGNLYKYNNGEDFLYYRETLDVVLELDDNGCPEPGLHSYTLKAKGVGITTLSKFTIDGELNQVFHEGEASEWLGDGSASEADVTDSHVVFGDLRFPDLGGEEWDWEANPGGRPDKVTEETILGGGNSGMGTLNNYDESLDIHDAYTKIGPPSTEEETVELIQIVVADGSGFSIDLSLLTSEDHNSLTGGLFITTHNLSFSLPTLAIGDANGDGFVDLDDAAILAENWLQSGNWAEGDFNGDGVINDLDATLLAVNWNPQMANVPEPSTLILLLAALFPLAVLRVL